MNPKCMLTGLLVLGLCYGCIDDRTSAQDDDPATSGADAGGTGDSNIPPPPPPADGGSDGSSSATTCNTPDDCPAGSDCVDGLCTEPECATDDQCTALVQRCIEGVCRDRCLGDRCVRGGVCVEGVCLPPECEADGDCTDGRRCRGGVCEEWTACESTEECGSDERCVAGACEALPECVGDRGCDDDSICLEGRCRPQADCGPEALCPANLDCVGGRCVPFVCRADTDCDGETLCRAGECVEVGAPEVATVIILNRPQTRAPSTTIPLRAIGLSVRGDIVTSDGFEWLSDNLNALAVDSESATGTVPADAASGAAASVTAQHTNPDGSIITSQPITIRVEAPAMGPGLTVSIVDATSGRPIGGAAIQADDVTLLTDETGRVDFADLAGEVTVTGFAAEYNYLTIVDLEIPANGIHIVLPLSPRTGSDRVAGFTGSVDFSRVESEGDVELGLTGPSFASGLTQVTFENLLGQTFNREINAGPINLDLPLPGGLTLSAEVPFVGRIDAKTTYYVSAEPGLRLGWSFGGRIDLQSVIGLAMDGEGDGIGRVLGVLLPYFETFNHGLRVGERLVELPKVVDDNDLDGDGDAMELIADYERLPVLNISPDQGQRLRLEIDAASAMDDGETAIFFPGVEFTGIGFVPLGVTAATEPGAIPARMAAPYGGLEGGAPTVLAISTNFGDANELPRDLTLRIRRYEDGVPRLVEFFDDTLQRPESVEYDPILRAFGGTNAEGAHFHRASFFGPEGRWEVYFGPNVTTELTLPVPPDGFGDLSAAGDVRLEAIILGEDVIAGEAFFNLVRLQGEGDLSQVDEKAAVVARKSL